MDHPTGCVLCPIYRPDTEPRHPRRPPVCDADRARLDRDLADITDLHRRLVNPERADVDTRTYAVRDQKGRLTGDLRHRDPGSALGGAGPVHGRPDQPHVTGSRHPPTPTNLDSVDLTTTARVPNPTIQALAHPNDQIGYLSAATVLDHIARHWRDTLWPDHHLPPATVNELALWLHNRFDDACTRHPAIADHAAALRALRLALRKTLGENEDEPRPELLRDIPCRDCDRVNVLVHAPGDPYVECRACGTLLNAQERLTYLRSLQNEMAAP